MKRLGKQLPSRKTLRLLFYLIALILRQYNVKDFRVTKRTKKIKFERVWGRIESKKEFLAIITHKISESNSSFDGK